MSAAPPTPHLVPHPLASRSLPLLLLSLLAPLLALTACRTPKTPPSIDTSLPGWNSQIAQALWTPRQGAQPLAGDLLIAQHPQGLVLLEMSKASLPICSLRLTPQAWRFDLTTPARHYSGSGAPPSRSSWFVLATILAGTPTPTPWSQSSSSPGTFCLSHPHTGERLEIHGLTSPPSPPANP